MLVLLRPEKFSVFVTAYRNLEKNAPKKIMQSFLEDIKGSLNSESLSKELRKNLYIFLGSQLVVDDAFLRFAEQADSDDNFDRIKSKVDGWEAAQDIAKIEALAMLKLDKEDDAKSKRIDTLLIYRLEKWEKYDLALALIEKTQKPYQNKLILAAMLRICRKKEDYAFVEKELDIDERFIDTSDFNLQYELVYYFRSKDDGEGLERTLRQMRTNATGSIPIARTLYNFYLGLDRFESAQNIYDHIRYLEQEQAEKRVQRKKRRTRASFSYRKDQMESEQAVWQRMRELVSESEQAVWQRMKELVSEQEHDRQMIALRDLLKGFSHELGQPITNIRYAVQLYQKKVQRDLETPEALQVLLSDILRQTDRIGTLLSRFGPIVSPKDESGAFSVRACAEKVFDDLKTRLCGQNITYQIDGPTDFTLSGDQVQFSQVFYNLALNAMQAIEKDGHITIDITGPVQGVLTILFTDNGPGIPEQNFQKVFEPFFSTKDPTSGNGGEGLGLYIVWNILKMFNGTIQIDKSFQSGARFMIQIQQAKGGV